MSTARTTTARFDLGDFRRTTPREQVLQVFAGQPKPLTAGEVHRRLRDRDINLASVYRAIELFCRLGILVTAGHGSQGRQYELSDAHRSHHHRLICEGCGRVTDFEDCFLEEFVQKIRARADFRVRRHELQFYGLCAACAR
jgi:Fur family transcriptional regulator, ferric uptake regulator